MSMYQFKVGDSGKTRDGEDYTVLGRTSLGRRAEQYPLLVEISNPRKNGETRIECYTARGSEYVSQSTDGDNDLIPPTVVEFVNLHANGRYYVYSTEGAARLNAGGAYIAVAQRIERQAA